ncbi:MAG: MCP four helix bundle domain-containing protein, partial [Curvibacter sp.]
MKKQSQPLLAWYAGLRIGVKLGGAFAIVLLLAALIGAMSLVGLQRVFDASSDLAHNYLPSLGHTTAARALLIEYRDFEVKHTRAADDGYMADYEDRMKELMQGINSEFSTYEKIPSSDDERKIYMVFRKALSDYLVINRQIIGLGRAKKGEDARQISDGAGKVAFDETISRLDALIAYNFKGGEAVVESAGQTFQSTRILMFGLLAGMLVMGLVMARLITRDLLRQLGGEPSHAAQVTAEIAQGKLHTDVPLRVGDQASLMASLRDMRDSLERTVLQVRERAEGIANASAEIAQGNQDLSARTESQASSLEETAASMEQLGSTVKQNADNARTA